MQFQHFFLTFASHINFSVARKKKELYCHKATTASALILSSGVVSSVYIIINIAFTNGLH